MPDLLCAHIPWLHLHEHRKWLLETGTNPEIYFSAEALDRIEMRQLSVFSGELQQNGLRCTIHAPFMDLNPGSVDSLIRTTTRKRVESTLECAACLRARVVVFHPGFSKLTYGSARDLWVMNTVAFWKQLLPLIENAGCLVALENIFEDEPSTLLQTLEQIDSPLVGHCFDSGHFNMFATVSPDEWFEAIGKWIIESHLHDNHGQADEHLPVGEGEIDFMKITGLLKTYAPDAVWTLEAHSRARLERAVQNIQPYLSGETDNVR